MRYAIGVKYKYKNEEKEFEGFYAKNKDGFGFSFILTDEGYKEELKNNNIPVLNIFDNAEEAVLYSQILSRAYRTDDSWLSKKKSKIIRRFYPVKVDSFNFPYTLKKISQNVHSMKEDRFRKKTNKPTLKYLEYEVVGKK